MKNGNNSSSIPSTNPKPVSAKSMETTKTSEITNSTI